MTKMFSAVKKMFCAVYSEIAIRFSVISLNLSNFLACYVNTAYLADKRMFHFAAILNFDALCEKYIAKLTIFL